MSPFTSGQTPPAEPPSRPMGPIYVAVVVVEVVTLLALWWFQTAFGAR